MEWDEDFLQEVSSEVDLVEYIGQDIELKRKGKDYFGRCSKHIDKTPSFSVNPEKNMYYCFSCGSGGGIIQYLQSYERLSFEEAVNKACLLANKDISKMCFSQTVKLLKKIRKNKQKKSLTIHAVLDEKEYGKYRKGYIAEWLNEGIQQSEIDLFDVRIDERSNRIVYPVRDIQGNLINIKGRTRFANYKEMSLMKYMNYFKIGDLDYFQGLDKTLPFVKESNEIILFESLKSVMKCYGWGYKNCASVENHFISDEQIRLLIRLRVDVVFAYDSDVSYKTEKITESLNLLKRFTNVYIVEDRDCLLGGASAKNSPADKGLEVFKRLYDNKKKVR